MRILIDNQSICDAINRAIRTFPTENLIILERNFNILWTNSINAGLAELNLFYQPPEGCEVSFEIEKSSWLTKNLIVTIRRYKTDSLIQAIKDELEK